jgi:hypothetical protein
MDQDKINQVIAFIVAVITGIVAYIKGRKSKSASSEDNFTLALRQLERERTDLASISLEPDSVALRRD